MNVTKTIKPGERGSQRFMREWGDRLVAVRYREDQENTRTYTTIEIIVDERARLAPDTGQTHYLSQKRKSIVALRIEFQEQELRGRVKANGARWSQQLKLWLMPYEVVVSMGLRDRIVEGAAEKCLDIDTSFLEMRG